MRLRSWLAIGAAGVGLAALVRAAGSQPDGHARQADDQGPRVVILGAGFAGLTAARTLARERTAPCRILLVDRNNYHLFTPMLYQAAACAVDPYDVANPIRQTPAAEVVAFRRGIVKGVDFEAHQVVLEDARLDYDYLVIALGATTNFFGNQPASQHAMPMKRLEDAVAIRHRAIDMLERASVTDDQGERRPLLTFVVVGGGVTGVETAAALNESLRRVIAHDYPRLDPDEVRVVVIEAEGKLLGHMGSRMAQVALRQLRSRGIEVWLNARAKDVSAGQVTTEDGRTVAAHTVIWATGVRAPDVVSDLRAAHGKAGSLTVDEYLQVRGLPGVYAIGDNAHFEDPHTHKSAPLLAEAAVQEGEAAGRNIALALARQPEQPFRYRSLGNVVSLGRREGAAEAGPLVIDGLAGWLAWRMIHLVKITSFRNRLATLVDWSVGYAYDEDTARLDLRPVPPVPVAEASRGG